MDKREAGVLTISIGGIARYLSAARGWAYGPNEPTMAPAWRAASGEPGVTMESIR
jgi:hypothetical protein